MMKKFGVVTVGVTAALLTAAPLASAGEATGGESAPSSSDHHGSGDHGKKHGKGDHKSHGTTCSFTGGSAKSKSEISGDSLSNIVTQTPVAGNNIANAADCSDFLNHNFSGNKASVKVAPLEVPELPEI